MNTNLLDDHNIESEHKSSFLGELKKVQVWLSISTAIGFMVGLALFFIALIALQTMAIKAFILGVLLIVQMCLVFYWCVNAFNYTRAIKWYDPEGILNRIEHLLESNSRLWRATGLFLLWCLCTLAYAFLGNVIG